MVGKFAQLCLAAGLSYLVHMSAKSLVYHWEHVPAEVPSWFVAFSHWCPWLLFIWLAIVIFRT